MDQDFIDIQNDCIAIETVHSKLTTLEEESNIDSDISNDITILSESSSGEQTVGPPVDANIFQKAEGNEQYFGGSVEHTITIEGEVLCPDEVTATEIFNNSVGESLLNSYIQESEPQINAAEVEINSSESSSVLPFNNGESSSGKKLVSNIDTLDKGNTCDEDNLDRISKCDEGSALHFQSAAIKIKEKENCQEHLTHVNDSNLCSVNSTNEDQVPKQNNLCLTSTSHINTDNSSPVQFSSLEKASDSLEKHSSEVVSTPDYCTNAANEDCNIQGCEIPSVQTSETGLILCKANYDCSNEEITSNETASSTSGHNEENYPLGENKLDTSVIPTQVPTSDFKSALESTNKEPVVCSLKDDLCHDSYCDHEEEVISEHIPESLDYSEDNQIDNCQQSNFAEVKTEISSLTANDAINSHILKSRLNYCHDSTNTRPVCTSTLTENETNTTQVVKHNLMFPYDHGSSYMSDPVTGCHSSINPLKSLELDKHVLGIKRKYKHDFNDDIDQRLSSSENHLGSRSIYTLAANNLDHKIHTLTGIQISAASQGKAEHLNCLSLDNSLPKLPVSEFCLDNKLVSVQESNYIDDDNVDMGSKNSVIGMNKQMSSESGGFLSEFPPDRSDGSDSGLGSELVDEPALLQADCDEAANRASKWETEDQDIQAVPSTSKQQRVIRSSLKRSSAEVKSGPQSKKTKRSIEFENVSIFYFPRTQGFICVPSQGGSTLGMSWSHSHAQTVTMAEHLAEQRRLHRHLIAQMRASSSARTPDTSSSDSDTDEQVSESEPDANYYFLQPVPTRQRRAMLRAAGVHKIDSREKDECRDIRTSRELCGCACKGYCDPDTCACSLAGIKCQVDRLNFPCGCSRDGCGNSSGRIEFNPVRVRTHFIHTLMRLDLEQKQAQEDEEAAQRQLNIALASNTNSCNTYAPNFPNISYRDPVYSYHTYNSTGSASFSYGYSGYLPTYEQSDVADFVSPVLEFQHSSYQSLTSAITFPQVESNQYPTEEAKLESFSELLQARYVETEPPVLPSVETVASVAMDSSETKEKHRHNPEESQTDNFGEIIKKTMVESVTA